jgi:hypothetical protein
MGGIYRQKEGEKAGEEGCVNWSGEGRDSFFFFFSFF